MIDKTINVNYFNKINTYNKAYLVGFIAADGAIVSNKNSNSKTLTITIHSKDVEVLKLLKFELNSSRLIQNINSKSSFSEINVDHVRFTTSRKEIIKDLYKLGIKPRKSLDMPNILKNIPSKFRKAFIIGYFDGDGCFCDSFVIRRRKYLKKDGTFSTYISSKYNSFISIKGTEELLKGIVDELKIINYRNYKIKGQNINTLTIIKNSEILKFYDCYNYCDFHFKRKKEKFTRKIVQVQTISSS